MANSYKSLMIDDMGLPRRNMIDVTLVTNSADALKVLKSDSKWDYLYLDHDLGGDDTIRPVIDFLVKNKRQFNGAICYLISSNPVGIAMMKHVLGGAGFLTITLNELQKSLLFDFRSWEDMTGD